MRFQVYLPWDEAVDSAFFSGFLSFWSYIIILNTVVPISLYVRYAVSLRRGLSRELRWSLGRLFSSVKVKSSRGNLGSSPSCAVNMLSVYLRGQSRLHCSFLGTLDCIRVREQATSETTSLLGACSCPVLASFTASLPRAQTSQITHTEPLPLVCSTASDLRCSTKLGRKIQENTFHDIHLGGKITKTESVVIQTSG